jgi:hypothetical protein
MRLFLKTLSKLQKLAYSMFLFPGNFLSIPFKTSKTSQRTELEHKKFQILKLNKRNKRLLEIKETGTKVL